MTGAAFTSLVSSRACLHRCHDPVYCAAGCTALCGCRLSR
jgi:hypothetical protein